MCSFLRLSNIPLYICTTVFIHSSVDGHPGGFHVLAIVNRAAMNIGLHVSFSVLVSSGICLIVVLFLVFFFFFYISSFLRNPHAVLGEGNGNPL